MKRLLFTLISAPLFVAATGVPAQAEEPSASSVSAVSRASSSSFFSRLSRMPSVVRFSVLGGPVAKQPGGAKPEQFGSGSADPNGGAIALALVGVGSGLVSVETGAGFLKAPAVARSPGPKQGTVDRVAPVDYAAFPLFVKLNYVERALASFYVKGGAIFASLLGDQDVVLPDGTSASRNYDDVFVVAGLGGTAPIGHSTAFVLDLSYLSGTKAGFRDGPRTEAFIGAVGLSFEL